MFPVTSEVSNLVVVFKLVKVVRLVNGLIVVFFILSETWPTKVVVCIFFVAVVVAVMMTVGSLVVDVVRHGALHCLGQEAISDGVEHVKMTHSGASCI